MQPGRPNGARADGSLASVLGALPPGRSVWIIVDDRRPERAAAVRRALAHATRVTVVPDLRRRERRQGRLAGPGPERRTGRDRRRAPPSIWTQLGMVVVTGADVAPPMEP
jgi:hypothetical protein